MQVKFLRSWFSPGGTRYRAGVHTIPDAMAALLPSSAEILTKPPEPPAPVDGTALLRAVDHERASAEALGAATEGKKR